MAHALRLAERALGRVWPNPAVGCILVDRAGVVVGRGHTQPTGRPHAETIALTQAGPQAQGATAYVTLEPCAHWGETGPCAEALLAAGVRRVVGAMSDPDPRVNGKGFQILRGGGAVVAENVGKSDAEFLNRGFLTRVLLGRPMVTLKLATSLDGRIALANGSSQWITGPQARAHGHWLRATHDAILTGVGTIVSDNAALTCRLPALADRSPLRIVLDTHLRIDPEADIVTTAAVTPTLVVTTADAAAARAQPLISRGVRIIEVPTGADGSICFEAALKALGKLGLSRLLIEGGSRIASSALKSGSVDRIAWYRAPFVIGGDGVPVFDALGITDLAGARRFARIEHRALGPDLLEILEANP